ncbi:MAG: class II histone deacetylase [Anaerolineales bacterium]|nr:class II histone deacetylase [Anaerolineales bacterium]
MTTGFLFHEKYMWHATGEQWLPTEGEPYTQPLAHVENPETKRRFKNLLDASALAEVLVPLKPRMATVEEIARVHEAAYIQRIADLSARDGGEAGFGTPFGRGGYEIALLSAGGLLAATDAVMMGQVQNAYALARPPGHHALPHTGYGFCIFNNFAIAIRAAQKQYGLKRIALIDWDAHHGNGAQTIFYNEPNVLTISLHQDRCYPRESGLLSEAGEGAGYGYNLNLPLPPGSGHGAYLAAFERVVIPALRRYQPELILVASGFDANYFDPLSRLMAYSETFRQMTRWLVEVAAEFCNGRIVMGHEGGYSPAYVPFCGLAVMEELSGASSGITDPFLHVCDNAGGQTLQPHQAAMLAEAETHLAWITAI